MIKYNFPIFIHGVIFEYSQPAAASSKFAMLCPQNVTISLKKQIA